MGGRGSRGEWGGGGGGVAAERDNISRVLLTPTCNRTILNRIILSLTYR